jgi:hypothetical protein
MNRIISKYKALPKGRQRGTIMVLTAVMITSMLGMMALSIDLGFIFSARNQFQNGIDAAALAAASALRVTIESDPGAPQQGLIARQQGKLYASLNEVRRYTPNNPDEGGNVNSITLTDGEITIQNGANGGLPRISVESTVDVPTLFAGIVGFYSMTIRARSEASLFPVDGGTGTVGSGTAVGGGCWRPLILPDSFYDSSGIPHVLYEEVGGNPPRVPNQNGDYYRSRFAAGARNTFPFVDALSGVGPSVTGLRDTQLATEIGTKTIMGRRPLTFRKDSYFVANFGALPRATSDVFGVAEWARFGYCGQIRVGDDIPVYPMNDAARIDMVRNGLIGLKSQTIDFDPPYSTEEGLYNYVVSNGYPGPNTHAAIIPVLLYDPFQYDDNPSVVRVTNIGMFLLNQVDVDGTIHGYFVREVFAGGTPIAAANFEGDSDPRFKQSWLPMSVRLLK